MPDPILQAMAEAKGIASPKGHRPDADTVSYERPATPAVPSIAAGLPPATTTVLDQVRQFLSRYVVASPHQLDALALWVAHVYAFGAAESTPYVSIRSAERRSGKSRLLETVALLVPRPLHAESISAAALAHGVDSGMTLLLDEVDGIFARGGRGPSETQEALRGILDGGHRLDGSYVRMRGVGSTMAPKSYRTFGPKMLSGLGELPGTLEDRCVVITLRRRTQAEHVERFRARAAREAARPIKEALGTWAASAVPTLQDARPDVPLQLDDRAQDGWEPLIAIADLAGGDWSGRARAAAVALSTGEAREDSESQGVRLLIDIYSVMADEDKIITTELVRRLLALDEAPWGDINGRPLDPRRLARLLKPFGIRPGSVRIGPSTAKGYERTAFADAWERYAPSIGPSIRHVRHNKADSDTATHPSQMAVMSPDVTDSGQIQLEANVTDVTDKNAVDGAAPRSRRDAEVLVL